MTTPNAMPARKPKTNPIHLQILGGLVATKTVSRTFKKLVRGDDGKETVVETKVTRQEIPSTTRPEVRGRWVRKGSDREWVETVEDVPVPTLAGNVSTENVERIAARWIK